MKSFNWKDFIAKIPKECVIAISDDFLENARFYSLKRIKLSENKIELFNGAYCDYSISVDFNRRVKFLENLNYFHLHIQKFDYVESGEFEEGLDGIDIPVFKRLDTFTIKTINVYILQPKKF